MGEESLPMVLERDGRILFCSSGTDSESELKLPGIMSLALGVRNFESYCVKSYVSSSNVDA